MPNFKPITYILIVVFSHAALATEAPPPNEKPVLFTVTRAETIEKLAIFASHLNKFADDLRIESPRQMLAFFQTIENFLWGAREEAHTLTSDLYFHSKQSQGLTAEQEKALWKVLEDARRSNKAWISAQSAAGDATRYAHDASARAPFKACYQLKEMARMMASRKIGIHYNPPFYPGETLILQDPAGAYSAVLRELFHHYFEEPRKMLFAAYNAALEELPAEEDSVQVMDISEDHSDSEDPYWWADPFSSRAAAMATIPQGSSIFSSQENWITFRDRYFGNLSAEALIYVKPWINKLNQLMTPKWTKENHKSFSRKDKEMVKTILLTHCAARTRDCNFLGKLPKDLILTFIIPLVLKGEPENILIEQPELGPWRRPS